MTRRAPRLRQSRLHRLLLERFTAAARELVYDEMPRANRLAPDLLEALFRQEPLLNRGITKHGGDLVKHGLRLVNPRTVDDHPDNQEWQSWARAHRVSPKYAEAIVSAHVYGDGLLEFEYDDGGDGTAPVAEGAEIVDLHVIDPVDVRFRRFKDPRDGRTRLRLVQKRHGGDDVMLHPDRYEHFKLKALPGFAHGLSTCEVAWHIGYGKVKADQGLGEIIFRTGMPLRTALLDSEDPDDVDKLRTLLQSGRIQHWLVWHNKLKVEQHNPEAPDPSPYYAQFEIGVAAAIGIPVMMLKGAQAGNVEGSETNLSDYHADLAQVQANKLEPGHERLISGALQLGTDEYDIAWKPFPTREDLQAQALVDRATAFGLLLSNLEPLAAARIAGLDVRKQDIRATPAGFLPPGAPPGAPGAGPPQQPQEGEEVGSA